MCQECSKMSVALWMCNINKYTNKWNLMSSVKNDVEADGGTWWNKKLKIVFH